MKFEYKKGNKKVTVNFVIGTGENTKNNFIDFHNGVANVKDENLIKIMKKDKRVEEVKEEETV